MMADTANHFFLPLQRPDWEVVFDTGEAQAAATRTAVFDMIATARLPFPSVGSVEKASEGCRFIPETYQFDL